MARGAAGNGTPAPAKPLKTTIDPDLQESAVANLGRVSGGVTVLDAKKGFIKALAVPPIRCCNRRIDDEDGHRHRGLETGAATMDSSYDYVTEAPADGRMIQNAHGEVCGGTFTEAFAKSCTWSVFAPGRADRPRTVHPGPRSSTASTGPRRSGMTGSGRTNPPTPPRKPMTTTATSASPGSGRAGFRPRPC